MHSYPSPQILHHMGKDLSFLPPKYMATLNHMEDRRSQAFFPLKCKAILPHLGKDSCLLSQSISFPSFSPKCNTTLPHKSSLIGKDSAPFKRQNPHKSFSTNSFLYLCFMLFLFICIFLFFFSFEFSFLSFFFLQNLEFFPKVEKLSPSVWGE